MKYLGLPLITFRLEAIDCADFVTKLCGSLATWTTKFLRYSSRLTLLKSVLFNIQGNWASYLFLPKGILDKLKSLFSIFLWGGNANNHC